MPSDFSTFQTHTHRKAKQSKLTKVINKVISKKESNGYRNYKPTGIYPNRRSLIHFISLRVRNSVFKVNCRRC